jgi:hypothetical protein
MTGFDIAQYRLHNLRISASPLGMPAQVGARLMALGNALRYIIVTDGKIVRTWRRLLRTDGIGFEPTLFRLLTASENQAFAAAAQRYGEFFGSPVIF